MGILPYISIILFLFLVCDSEKQHITKHCMYNNKLIVANESVRLNYRNHCYEDETQA